MLDQIRLNDTFGRLAAVKRIAIWEKARNPEFGTLSDLIASVFQAPIAIVSLIDDKRQWYISAVGMEHDELPTEMTFCQYTIRQQQVLAIEDTFCDERVKNHPFVVAHPHIRSYLGIPLTTPDGYNVGTVCICDFAPRVFSPQDFSILRNFAKVAMGYFDLRQIALRDPLTGAWSRRAFMEQAEHEVARHRRSGKPLSLALYDLDHFKSINDKHGHPQGDVVLKRTAATVLSAMRAGEVLGRIGGEEFAVVLPETDEKAAITAVERYRRTIEAIQIDTLPACRITASFGISTMRSGEESLDAFMERTDAALYRAKELGRNRYETNNASKLCLEPSSPI